jgi:hypothetical protein
MSTGYPEKAAMFERKASELATRPAPPPSSDSAHQPWDEDGEPLEFDTMIEAVILILEVEARPMRAREIWTAIEESGFYTRSKGKTPWATIGAKLATQTDLFERVAPGLYRLRQAA